MDDFGSRLKRLRKEKAFTLKEVAEKTNLSVSFLSQLEHNKSSVTLESLRKISEALSVNPSYFFSQEDNFETGSPVKKIVANNAAEVISDFSYKDLSGNFNNQTFLPTLVTLKPRKEGIRPLAHKGQEFIYVLSGTLTIIFDTGELSLEVGESIHMESTVPHNWMNKTDDVVEFIYVSAP